MTEEITENTQYTKKKIPTPNQAELDAQKKKYVILSVIGIIVVIALIVLAAIFLLSAPEETTAKIRDVFIIFMALESLVIGVALVVLIVQLSTLINLLQNEIRPIINSTNETVNTLKGTAKFISDHLAEPVIKINQFMAQIRTLIGPLNRKGK